MGTKRLASGYIKVERSQDEKRRVYSVDIDAVRNDLRGKIPSRIAEAIIKTFKKAKEK
jgi:hypothetical protein